jgi:hypothetical protein
MVEVHKARELTSKVLDLGASHGVNLPGYEVALDHLAELEKNAGPKADICGIYGQVRLESGLHYKNNI